MITFKKLEVRNFLSFGNAIQELDIDFNGTTLIIGRNVDTGGANGVGKSTIINAISYAIFNKPISNISKERLINKTNSAKNTLMEVRLSFCKNEDEFEIYRTRGESNTVQLFQNGVDITPDSIAITDKRITELIGFSYELFVKVIIFSGNDIPFLEMSVSNQRTLIEELFNITILSEKAANLKDMIKETETDIQIKEKLLDQQLKNHERQLKQVEDAKARVSKWDADREVQIQKITTDLEDLSTIDFALETEAHQLLMELKPSITKLNNEKQNVDKDLSRKTKQIEDLMKQLSHLELDQCPYCLQKYADSFKKIDELKKSLDECESEAVMLVEKNEKTINSLQEFLSQEKEALSICKFSSITEATRKQTSVEELNKKLTELKNGVNPHIEAYEVLKEEAIEEVDFSELDKLKKHLEHQQFLLKLLTNKDSFVRKKIINKTIPFLNTRINSYTQELGLPHIVRFDDDMSCSVSEFDRDLDFGNLSSGEKKRVNLALSLAFRDVFHQIHNFVNCLFLDEIEASLDVQGLEAVIKTIKNKSRDEGLGIWIISNRSETGGRFDRQLTVIKENGFSNIHFE
jgi:DNA repair exonuclease SbcCD ATPase subunit